MSSRILKNQVSNFVADGEGQTLSGGGRESPGLEKSYQLLKCHKRKSTFTANSVAGSCIPVGRLIYSL